MYAQDPALWKEHVCPLGALEEWIIADRQSTWADFLTEEAVKFSTDYVTWLTSGLRITDSVDKKPQMNWAAYRR
jgi:hypothetical protein